MSKQPNDQDEKQTSSDATPQASASANSGVNKGADSDAKRTDETHAVASGASAVAKPDDKAKSDESGKPDKPEKGRSEARSRRRRGRSGGGSSSDSSIAAAPPGAILADTSSAELARAEQGEPATVSPNTSSNASTAEPAKPNTGKPDSNTPGKDKPAQDNVADPQKKVPPKSQSDETKPAGTAGVGGGSGRSGAGGPPRDTRRGGGKFGLAALVLAIVVGAALMVFAWQAWERLDAQQQRLAELESGQQASGDNISEIESRLGQSADQRDAALDEALQSMRQEFGSYREEVNETLDRVLSELSSVQETDEREWLHAEAAYLLRLANQRLQLERDVEGSAALLRTADARLVDADNPALMPIRRAIASELAELDAVPRIDRTGLYLSLDAQQQQLSRLPLNQDIEQLAAAPGDDSPPTGTWQQQLSRFGGELRDLVTVRRHDEALEALISPQQESYLRQNVRLLVEQAQLALLQEEQTLYEASLDKAMELVERYYDTDRDGVQRSLERLSELRDASIRPELPDISGSQQALAEFIERRFNGGTAEENGGQGDDA
ncbi:MULTISPECIES: uroporphyrinogen-III C-methyltransferase [Halomonadaceae]|uniref:uroporphyrinogen-III C-methyltransferase n=1 Tax=Halomonadaceae TaxID=28256 RepID=UPI00159A03FE|nr:MULTISPECIES: uroporphyrinogen-III C-methyltransferase [Halomonas]QJQ95449.1 hypothetical protein HIO72_09290 [Halomonas sp. PA5]